MVMTGRGIHVENNLIYENLLIFEPFYIKYLVKLEHVLLISLSRHLVLTCFMLLWIEDYLDVAIMFQ